MTCVCAHVFARRASVQREQLETIASRDPLTGAGNRRALQSGIDAAVSAARRGSGAARWQARADAAMYRAKHAGRDRCVIDGDEGDDAPASRADAAAPAPRPSPAVAAAGDPS